MATWSLIALVVLAVLALIGDKSGKDRYGDSYRFDDGVDR